MIHCFYKISQMPLSDKYILSNTRSKISDLREAYLFACRKDIEAIKPGNVNINSPHKDMNAEDFITSSISSSIKMFEHNISLGERILWSIEATKSSTSMNTNLGIILLCAPIIHALINYPEISLREGISLSINNSSKLDTRMICSAINIASPAGLDFNHDNQKYDTRDLPDISLRELMCHSSDYDRISYEYCHDYSGIIDYVVPLLSNRVKNNDSIDISVSLTFVEILANIEDSHICRKLGNKIAKKTSNHANDLLKILDKESDRDYVAKELNNLDYEYKKKGINPGTTADLLIASLMIYKIFESDR